MLSFLINRFQIFAPLCSQFSHANLCSQLFARNFRNCDHICSQNFLTFLFPVCDHTRSQNFLTFLFPVCDHICSQLCHSIFTFSFSVSHNSQLTDATTVTTYALHLITVFSPFHSQSHTITRSLTPPVVTYYALHFSLHSHKTQSQSHTQCFASQLLGLRNSG